MSWEVEAPACSSGDAASVVADCGGPCVPLEEGVPAWLVAAGDPSVEWASIEGVWLLGWEGDLNHFSAIHLWFPADACNSDLTDCGFGAS